MAEEVTYKNIRVDVFTTFCPRIVLHAASAWTLCSLRSILLWYGISIRRSTTSTQQIIGPLSLDFVETLFITKP